jgi:GDPmannose 4,6-dehydratase
MATALITGITGQDGWYLAQSLLKKGDHVVGLTRDIGAAARAFDGGHPQLALRAFDYFQPGAIGAVIEAEEPDYIFNLASFATGQGMFDMPMEMVRLNGVFVLDILEALRKSARGDKIAFVQASSSEMFGAVTEMPQNETTPLHPKSPYGAAKQFGHVMTGIYRDSFGVKASSAILFNHESVRRPAAFVTKKIARGAARIRAGLDSELALGSLDVARDWGYAQEYVDAMLRMAMAPMAEDFVVATGRLSTIQDLVTIAFERVGLDWGKFVKIDQRFVRPIESIGLCGDPSRIAQRLGWRASVGVDTIVAQMVDHELAVAYASI